MDIKSYITNKSKYLKRLRENLRKYRLQVWLLEGEEMHSGQELQILYAGQEKNKNYIVHIAYGDRCREVHLGKAWAWSIARIAESHPAVALIVTETMENYFNRFGDPDDYYIPCWIDGDIEFSRYTALVNSSENIKSDLRKIRKQNYQYEITRDKDKFDLFYYTMYRPYIIKAHGNRAAMMSYEAMMSQADITELLLIKQGDDYVAGENLLYEERSVRAWSLGVKDGDHNHVKSGAIGALQYYMINYLLKQGYDRYNAGASRAFLKDGVLQYKRKWGLRLTHERPGGFWLRITVKSDGVKTFLRNNPFIHSREGKLNGFVLIGDNQEVAKEMINNIRKTYEIAGLYRLNIAYIDSMGNIEICPE